MLIRQFLSKTLTLRSTLIISLMLAPFLFVTPSVSEASNMMPPGFERLNQAVKSTTALPPMMRLAKASTTASGTTVPLPPHPFRNRQKTLHSTGTSSANKRGTKPRSATHKRTKIKKGMALLNFSDAKLKNVIMTISDITGRNFILSPEVINRKISIRTTKPIRKRDVFGIFETILSVNGLASVRTGDFYTIVIAKSARQGNLKLYTATENQKLPRGDAMINVLVPMKFISAKDMVDILRPTLSAGGDITIFSKANTLILTDTASNVKKIISIIDELDVDLFDKLNVSLVHINNVDVTTLAVELHDIFKALGYDKDSQQFSAIPMERFNSIILFSSNDQLLSSARKWITELDKASSSDEITTHIYYVKNDKASNIKGLLTNIYGDKNKDTSSTENNPDAVDTAPAKTNNKKTKKTPVTVKAATDLSTETNAGDSQDMQIFLYEPSNAIIIRSSEREYQYMLSTIRELDRPPKQVLIDAIVVEVALDDSMKYGVQWSALSGNVSTQSNTGIFSNSLADPRGIISTPIGAAALTGLNVLATDGKNFFGFLQALASDGKVNVLSNPHILVKNYEKASITVGSDEPIATQSSQNAVSTTASIIQNIEYRKTGIVLTVSPQITDAGMVALTLHQEISDVSTSRVVGSGSFPSFTNREAETSVVIKNGETIAIGGLIDTKKNKTHSAIPLISRVPLLGNLFKFTTITSDRTELIILLTPRVISNSDEAHDATNALKLKLSVLSKYMEMEKERKKK